MRKEVLFSPEAFAMQRWGGVSHSFCRIAEALRRMDWQVRIFAGFHGNRHLAGVGEVPSTGFFVGKSKQLWKTWLKASHLWLRMSGGVGKGCILQDTYYFARYRDLYPDSPYVVTIHDMIGELFPNDSGWSERARARKHAAVRAADVIVTPSRATADDLVRLLNVSQERVFVAPHGVSLLPPAPWTPPPWPFVLHVGGRKRYKDFGTARRAMGKLRAEGFDIGLVCFGEPLGSGEVNELAKDGIPGDRVVQESGTDEKLATIYRAARLLIYQSTYEGFGMPILEAMANGCPVVCSDTPACVEAAGGAALVAGRGDSDAFAREMKTVLEEPGTRATLVEKGKDRASQQAWATTAAAYEKAYEAAWEFHRRRRRE